MNNAKKFTILMVDDKPEILTAMVEMLKDRFTVMAVTGCVAALKVIEKHTPDLFLLDIEMPDINGYELAGLLRQHKKFENTPILFLTSKNTLQDVVKAVSNGGNDYILKPVERDLLLFKLQRYLGPF